MTAKEGKNYKGKTVLIIDDDIDIIEQLKFNLDLLGFEVITGESQAEGEKLIEKEDFDIAILDLMMENRDSGFILSYKIKKKDSNIPVIMITGVSSETGFQFESNSDDARSWIKADVVLDKDIRFEQVQREINRLLQ